MSLGLLLLAPALAGEPTFAGVPVDDLPRLARTAPTFLDGVDGWRAVAPGGWALHRWAADAAGGTETFRFLVATVQAPLPAVVVPGADEARGDDHFVVARRANVVVQVRAEHALAEAAALLAAEVPEGPATLRVAVPGLDPVTPRDPYGRRAQ